VLMSPPFEKKEKGSVAVRGPRHSRARCAPPAVRACGAMVAPPVAAEGGGRGGEALWVGVRLRPLNEVELYRSRESVVFTAADERTLRFDPSAAGSNAVVRALPPASYTFDAVYGPAAGNEDVYRDAASPLVRSAMTGVNGTLFAYGQTGSGKTYTVKAVMEAATAQVFDCIKATPGREFLLRLSAVEIYNEARAAGRARGSCAASPRRLRVFGRARCGIGGAPCRGLWPRARCAALRR